MANGETADDTLTDGSRKTSKLPLMLGLLFALVFGGGAYYAVSSGTIFNGAKGNSAEESFVNVEPLPDIIFVPVDPLVVSLGSQSDYSHLQFEAQLEVVRQYQDDVSALMPRIVDVLNGYLRAVDVRDFEEPSALIRLRAQMLRRVQIVTGDGRVRGLLVMKFVVN